MDCGATFEASAVSTASTDAPSPSWLQLAGLGLTLGAAVALLEFAYYSPLVTAGGAPLLGTLLVGWGGEGVLLGLGVGLFTVRKAPWPLSARRLLLAVAVGSIASPLAWQAFVQLVLRERLGMRMLRDYMDQP